MYEAVLLPPPLQVLGDLAGVAEQYVRASGSAGVTPKRREPLRHASAVVETIAANTVTFSSMLPRRPAASRISRFSAAAAARHLPG
jgi:hypothetical protein